MKSDSKRQTESAVGRISSKAPRKVNLPFSEAELLVGLDADGAL
ncbi:hypothetical protein [Thalassospira lucentensis]|nr:hypothetical protein [Thalassospira lucentensis]